MALAIEIILTAVDQASEEIKKTQKQISQLRKNSTNALKKMKGALLGFGLSTLFTGMAIKRLGDQAMRSLFNTMQMVMGETSEFAVLTNKVRANWEFLKFSIMDALMQTGVFQSVVKFILDIINNLQQLSPQAKATFGKLILGAIVAGGLMMIVGQTALALLAPLALLEVASGAALLPLALVLVTVVGLIRSFKNSTTEGEKILRSFLTFGIVGLGLMALAFFGVITAAGLLIGGIAILIAAAVIFKEEWMNGLRNIKLMWIRWKLFLLESWLELRKAWADLPWTEDDPDLSGLRREISATVNTMYELSASIRESQKEAEKMSLFDKTIGRLVPDDMMEVLDAFKNPDTGKLNPTGNRSLPETFRGGLSGGETINQQVSQYFNIDASQTKGMTPTELRDFLMETGAREIQSPQRGAGQ